MEIDTRTDITLSDARREKIKARIIAARRWMDVRQELDDEDAGKGFDSRSERNLALVHGRNYWAKRNRNDIRQINYLRMGLEIKHGIITSGKTEFLVTPKRTEFESLATPVEADLNNMWHSRNVDHETEKAYWDRGIHPTGGVIELSWEYKDKYFDTQGARPDATDIADAFVKDADSETVPPAFTPQGDVIGVPVQNVDEPLPELPEAEVDAPKVERFDSRELYIDPACESADLHRARYAYRRKQVLVSKLQATPGLRYRNMIHGGVPADGPLAEEKPNDHAVADIAKTEILDFYSYLDLGKGEQMYHVVWSKELSKELLCEPHPIKSFARQANPFPWEIIPASVWDNDALDCVTDVEAVMDVQKTHDLCYTQVERARARSTRILIHPEELFEGPEGKLRREAFQSGQEFISLPLSRELVQQANVIRWLDPPPVHNDAYGTLEAAPAKILAILGVNEYQGNMLPGKQMTKAEVGQVSSQGSVRQQREVTLYMDFLQRVAFKMLLLMQEFTYAPREYSFTGLDGKATQGEVTRETMLGVKQDSQTEENPLGDLHEPGIQFAIEIDVSKKNGRNSAMEFEQLMQLASTLAPLASMDDPEMPTRKLLDARALGRAMVKSAEVPGTDSIVPSAPTPEEKEQAMQEMAATQAQMGPQGPEIGA